jgi:hypothetical protein
MKVSEKCLDDFVEALTHEPDKNLHFAPFQPTHSGAWMGDPNQKELSPRFSLMREISLPIYLNNFCH